MISPSWVVRTTLVFPSFFFPENLYSSLEYPSQKTSSVTTTSLETSSFIISRAERAISNSFGSIHFLPSSTLNKIESDRIARVLDGTTVKLKKKGVVGLAGMQSPGYNNANECSNRSPSFKIRQLLPFESSVKVLVVDQQQQQNKKALIWNEKTQALVNTELVGAGFAKPSARLQNELETLLPGISAETTRLQQLAQDEGRGMYTVCKKEEDITMVIDDTEYNFNTQEWSTTTGTKTTPSPPNDNNSNNKLQRAKKCSDFSTYEDALEYYEYKINTENTQVASKLDRDGDGVPCPGLPHTKNQERYRMKIPKK